MKIHNKPTYKCDYCNKLYQIRAACEKHEVKCNSNPENFRACGDCKFCEKVEEKFYIDMFDGEHETKVKVFKCTAKNIFIHPPKVERSEKGAYEFGDTQNIPMAKIGECDVYVHIWD